MSTAYLGFDLPLPADFRGLDERAPIEVYYRNLPHWRHEGATYAVTMRLADALPQSCLRQLRALRVQWEAEHPEPRSDADWLEFAKRFTRAANRYLDEGYGACLLGRAEFAELVGASFRHFDGERYELGAYVVMPNHCHLVMRPYSGYKLEDLLGAMKKFISRRINAVTRGQGGLFQRESHDRIVRDTPHLWECVQYVGDNPRKAGLPAPKWHRWLAPSWRALGWQFMDGEKIKLGQEKES